MAYRERFCLSFFAVLAAISVALMVKAEEVVDFQMPKRDDLELQTVSTHHSHHKLPMDTASLTIISKQQEASDVYPLHIYAQYDVCWKCPLLKIGEVQENQNLTLLMNTQFKCHLEIWINKTPDNATKICSFSKQFGEYGKYALYIDCMDEAQPCNLFATDQPVDSFIPIYVAMGIIVLLSLCTCLMHYLQRRRILSWNRCGGGTEGLVDSDLGTPTNQTPEENKTVAQAPVPRKQRLRSLDAFRGLSLIVMVFANYGGGDYWFFKHSAWNGLTVADLVFPWFVFIMGTSIALAFRGLLLKGIPRKKIALKVIKRTVYLFVLGLLVSNFGKHGAVDLSMVRIPGVLQRLAVTYCVVALLEVLFARPDDPYHQRWWSAIRDIVPFWPEWLAVMSIVTVHILITFCLPVPGCPTGYLGPGGLHDNGAHWNCTGGAAGEVDRRVFGVNHIYQHSTCKKWYHTDVSFDPEGLLGTCTSILICFLGLQAGKIIITYKDWVQRIRRLLVWALTTGLIAGILCKFSQNDGWIPVNKNFWSVSFVLALSSMAFVLLTIIYIVTDVYHLWSGTPFIYPGMNSIVVYMCSEIFEHYFPVQFKVSDTHAAQLAMACYGTAIWWIMSYIMYRKKVFVAL